MVRPTQSTGAAAGVGRGDDDVTDDDRADDATVDTGGVLADP